jgi:FixJ family two-component response regulator
MKKMNKGIVYIIDDDLSIRRSLSLLLAAHDYPVETFSGSDEFLETESFDGPGCILLDINLEGKSGLQLQEELLTRECNLPVIFMTGHGNVKLSVETLKKGALNFLEKPCDPDDLLKSIDDAMKLSNSEKERNEEIRKVRQLASKLSPRESEVLRYIISGMLNKQIASELNIAEHTVKLHRHSISEKLGVKSVPEIIRIADKAGVKPIENKFK